MTDYAPVLFQALEWRETNEAIDDDEYENDESNEKKQYTIHIFGRTLDDKSVHVKLLDYTPHFYVLIPDFWNKTHINVFINALKKMCRRYQNNFLSYEFIERKIFEGFTNEKMFKFIRLLFNNDKAMQSFGNALSKEIYISGLTQSKTLFRTFENKIDSFLRVMHIRDVLPCGWLIVSNYKHIDNDEEPTTTDINIVCKWSNLQPNSNQNLGGAPFKIMSWDLECRADDGKSFPVPTNINDEIIQVGCVFSRYGGDIYKKIIIVLGTCDNIADASIISVQTEKELILEFVKLITNEDPDVMVGYNVWKFDSEYLHERAKILGCAVEMSKISKLKNHVCAFVKKEMKSAGMGDNELTYYESLGRLQIDLYKIVQNEYKLPRYRLDDVAENFIQEKIIEFKIIDEYNLEVKSKNIHFLRLGNYVKLVTQVELEYGMNIDGESDDDDECIDSEDKDKYKITFIDYANNKMIISCTEKNIEHGSKFTHNELSLKKDLKWGLVKDDLKAQDMFAMHLKTSAERKIIADYCLQDCVLVTKLMAKLEIMTNKISMANVCSVPFYYLLTRGQGIKSLSLVSKTCRKHKFLLPTKYVTETDDDKVGYEGATVFVPKIGFYQTPIVVKDFNSLYPSSIIAENISHDTIVFDKQYDNLPNYTYNDVYYNNDDGSVTHCRFAKHKDKLGILAEILECLLQQRKQAKNEMESEPDQFKKSILDGKQLALKVTANSLYGQLGASVSQINMKELAACTTATGRKMLELARDFVEGELAGIINEFNGAIDNDEKIEFLFEKYLAKKTAENKEFIKKTIKNIFCSHVINPRVIYGDTDSVFIDMRLSLIGDETNAKITTKEGLTHCIEIGKLSSMFLQKKLKYPHVMAYEKTFHPFCIMSKKRYVGNKYEDNAKKFKQSSSGIVLKRRDNANIVKKVIGGLVNIMMNENNIEKAITYIKISLDKLFKGGYPISDFVTTKTLKGSYKGIKKTNSSAGKMGDKGKWDWDDVDCQLAHVKLCQRMKERDPGSCPATNDRVPYVAIKKNNCTKKKVLQADIIEHIDYVKQHKLQIDYLFYLTNQIMVPAIQILELLIENPQQIFDKYIYAEKTERSGQISLLNYGFKSTNDEMQIIKIDIDKKESNVEKVKVKYIQDDINISNDPYIAHMQDIVKKTNVKSFGKSNDEIKEAVKAKREKQKLLKKQMLIEQSNIYFDLKMT